MLLTRKQSSKALLKDVGKAASRIADESRSVAQTARSELSELAAEVRDQASDKKTHGKKRRRIGLLLIPAAIAGVVAARFARHRRDEAQSDEQADVASDEDVAASEPVASSTDKSNGGRAKQTTAQS